MSRASKISKPSARRAFQVGALAVAVGAGYGLHSVRVSAQGGTTIVPMTNAPAVETAATRSAAETQNAFSDVATAVSPAVVTITTMGPRPTHTSAAPNGMMPFGGRGGQGSGNGQGADPFNDFQQFFKQFQQNFGFQQQNFNPNSWEGRVLKEKALVAFQKIQDGRSGGLGSGMIFRSDGLILTNAHVVESAATVSVTLSDGRIFDKAKVLGRDLRTDIAVVKIDATDLPTVNLGDSSKIRVGDWAIAVGNPFGLDHTVTVGVISAKSRELNLAQDTRTDYLQTDASINPGNSGGPLVDIYGRVIGIDNAIYSESGGNQGIGFAIPVNTARFVADRIVKDGRVRRAYLGVKIANVEDRGQAFGLSPSLKGVLVEELSDPNGPGAKAGLQPGDVITKFNDTSVDKSSQLQSLVGNSPVGSTVTLTVVRDNKTITLNAQLDELKDSVTPDADAGAPMEAPGDITGTSSPVPGLKVHDLTPAVAHALGIKATSGVVVTDVADNSPAQDAGLMRGDVIERVGQNPVASTADLQANVNRILNSQTGEKKVALYISRGGQHSFVIVTIGG